MMLGCNSFLHSFSEVVPQVPSVGDFDRIRRSGTGRFGIGAGAVAADDLGTGMCSQLFGDGIGFAIGENIDWTVSIHVDQNCAVPMSPSQLEIIDTEHLDNGRGRIRQRSDQPQQGRSSDGSSQRGCQPQPCSSGQRESDLSRISRSSGVVRA